MSPGPTPTTPDPVLLDNGDVLVPVQDDQATDGLRMLRVAPEEEDYAYWLAQAQQAAAAPTRRGMAASTKLAGKITVLVGSVGLIASFFLTYASSDSVSKSLWQATTRMPLILTLLAATAIVVTVVSFFVDLPGFGLVAAVVSFFALGETFPLIFPQYPFQEGFWIGVVSAAAMGTGSVLIMAAHSRPTTPPPQAARRVDTSSGPTSTRS